MNNDREITNAKGVVNARAYMRFFQKCQKSGTLALPIFSKAQN